MRILLVASLALAACSSAAAPPVATSPSPTATPERIVIEGDTATQIVETASGRTVASLPGGILSPSRDLVVRLEATPSGTGVRGVDLDGLPLLKVDLAGRYAFPSSYGPAPTGFSPNGKWLVLVSRDTTESRFAVIDTDRSKLVAVATLGSRFTFDAIHNDGSAMYLIEHPDATSTRYNVRLYNLRSLTLAPEIIFDKTQIAVFDPTVGLMDGTFHVSVAPKAGDWTYGLYLRPTGAPFVHALNVPGHYAQCIVDVGTPLRPGSYYSLALSDDGRRLFVVDTVGGSIAAIDGLTQKVAARATFAGTASVRGAPAPVAVVSPDGGRLYATAPRGVGMFQASDLALRGWFAPDLEIRSLAISRDGSRLYALADGEVRAISIATGSVTRVTGAAGARAIQVLR